MKKKSSSKRPPKGYTYKYVYPDSDFIDHKVKRLVKKKKGSKK